MLETSPSVAWADFNFDLPPMLLGKEAIPVVTSAILFDIHEQGLILNLDRMH